jgi:hypothetical protein
VKRTPLKRGTRGLRRRTPLRPISDRRRGELRLRAVVRAEVLGRDGGCVARDRLPQVDCGGSLDVHELVRRSQWRAGWLVPSNAIVLCRNHHSWCHDHPLEARNLGLLRLAHEAGE